MVRLCRQHHLYSALAFLFPRALLDFIAPAAELTVAVAYASDEPPTAAGDPGSLAAWSERRQLAFKLLVYLRTCFRGLSFPPGKPWPSAGTPFRSSAAPQTDVACSTHQWIATYDLHWPVAFFQCSCYRQRGSACDSRSCLQGAGCWTRGRCRTPGPVCWASCCTAPHSSLSRLLQAFGADESVGSAAALAELLPGPHPVLRCLASVDAGGPCCTPSTCVGRHTQMLHGYRPSRVIDMCARAVPVVSCLH